MTDAPKRIWVDGNQDWDSGSWGLDHEYPDDVEYILATPEALAEAPEVQRLIAEAVERATRVKPLVWEDRGGVDYASDRYLVQVFFGSDQYYFETWDLSLGLKLYDGDDLPSAKAAAQADYEQRIRAAIGGNDE
jgi:hypothetical protein